MSLYVGGTKYSVTKALYRGFYGVVVHGFAGTTVTCLGTTMYIGSNEMVTFKITEGGTYTFTASRQGETITKEVTLDNKNYIIDLPMFIGLQPVEYIESTGTQYIDTGILPKSAHTKVVVETMVTINDDSDGKTIFGSRDNYQSGYINAFVCSCLYQTNNRNFRCQYGTNAGNITSSSSILDKKITFELDKNTFTTKDENGNIIGTITYTLEDFTGLYPMLLFAWNIEVGVLLRNSGVRIYSCKIYDDDTLVSDFIPVKDNTSHGALYDKVSGQIFYNAGTGEFICGENKPYTRIAYLEFTGTQYIDTGFKVNQDTRVIMTYLKQSGNDDIGWLFGSRNSQNVSSFGVFYDNSPAVIQTDYDDQRNSITNRIYDKKLIVDKNKNITKIIDFDTGDILATNTSAERTFSSNYNLYLSALNNGGSISLYKTKSIYSCKIYDNGTLVRDFVPVLDYNGTPCMLDRVDGALYYNQGTGQFIPGPEYVELEYIESTGTQWIDTGFHPDNLNTTRFMIMCQFTGGESGDWLVNGISSRQGNGFYVGMTDTTRNQFVYLYNATDVYTNVSIPDRFGLYTYDYNGPEGYFKVIGGSSTLVNTSLSTITPSTKPSIVIFGYNNRNEDGSPQTRCEKIYYCKIYSEGVLVRDFVPAKRSDNVLGMYDNVTGTFFTNAGTGEFIAGPEK